jgi:hypothetical protein
MAWNTLADNEILFRKQLSIPRMFMQTNFASREVEILYEKFISKRLIYTTQLKYSKFAISTQTGPYLPYFTTFHDQKLAVLLI